MKVFVTGAAGQLGHDVVRELAARGHEAVGSDREAGIPLDITDREAVRAVLSAVRPEAVIHCAAWTAVDAAEAPENRERVHAVNGLGPRYIAEACRELGCKMLHISTDYVFDGRGTAPWTPDCTDYGPLSVYGQSKLEGEQAVAELLQRYFIVRIAWAFGPNGANFVRTMLRLAQTHDTLRVVCDQIGTPTYTPDLARLLADMVETNRYGIYHATNEGGYISWYDFACEIFRQAGKNVRVLPVTSAEYGQSQAARPMNSRLDKSKLPQNGFAPLPDWRDALGRYLNILQETKQP